jgi:hypothetical protein
MSYVIRHGRRIEIETHPDPPEVATKLQKREKRKQEAFAIVPLWWAAQASKAGGTPELLVCADLLHRAWRAKGKSFDLPNGKDVSRKVKYRVLHRFEKAGLIKVEWRHKQSPIITMTPPIK